MLDYAYGAVALVLPWIFGFDQGPERWVLFTAGVVVIVYSLFTDYSLGLVRVMPFNLHLLMDVCVGIILILLPIVLPFSFTATWTYIILGLVSLGAGALTRGGPRVAYPEANEVRGP